MVRMRTSRDNFVSCVRKMVVLLLNLSKTRAGRIQKILRSGTGSGSGKSQDPEDPDLDTFH